MLGLFHKWNMLSKRAPRGELLHALKTTRIAVSVLIVFVASYYGDALSAPMPTECQVRVFRSALPHYLCIN